MTSPSGRPAGMWLDIGPAALRAGALHAATLHPSPRLRATPFLRPALVTEPVFAPSSPVNRLGAGAGRRNSDGWHIAVAWGPGSAVGSAHIAGRNA